MPIVSGPFLTDSNGEHQQVKKGVIPNQTRADEIATQVFNAAKKEQSTGNGTGAGGATTSKSSFFRRRREKSRLRSKSLGKVCVLCGGVFEFHAVL